MNDKTLLELAAKATTIVRHGFQSIPLCAKHAEDDYSNNFRHNLGVPTNNEPCMYCFNELLQARAAAEIGKAA